MNPQNWHKWLAELSQENKVQRDSRRIEAEIRKQTGLEAPKTYTLDELVGETVGLIHRVRGGQGKVALCGHVFKDNKPGVNLHSLSGPRCGRCEKLGVNP